MIKSGHHLVGRGQRHEFGERMDPDLIDLGAVSSSYSSMFRDASMIAIAPAPVPVPYETVPSVRNRPDQDTCAVPVGKFFFGDAAKIIRKFC